MAIFIWNDDFCLGVEEIDQQHRKLVDIINELHGSMEVGANREQVIALLDDLIDYTHYHFSEEEQFMLSHGYDERNFKSHQASHHKFLQRIKQEQRVCHEHPEKVTDKLLDFLVNWILNHILGEDKQMTEDVLSDKQSQISRSNIDILKNHLYGALRESEGRFRELSDSLPAYIWISNEKGQRIYCNNQWQLLTGLSCEQLSNRWPTVICVEDRESLLKKYDGMNLHHSKLETEYRVVDKEGGTHWLLETVVARVHKNNQLVGYMGCAIDITRQKEVEQSLETAVQQRTIELQASNEKLAEEKQEQVQLNRQLQEVQAQVVQAEKMASIGQLAAGVAHEINNPLGYIHSNLHTLQQYLQDLQKVTEITKRLAAQLPSNHADVIEFNQMKQDLDLDFMQADLQDLVNESMEGARRAQQIVLDLRNFSRVNSQQREMFNIEKGIDSTLNIVYNELKYKAKVHKEYAGLKPYECVGSQLNQIFMNLLINAAHAIEEFGDITIRTGYKGQDWLWVEVEDSGKGMSQEVQNKMFDPFFTTKPVGQGTGLGLSLAYKIIKDHHGEVEVDSDIGVGTRIRIYFPLNPEKKSNNE